MIYKAVNTLMILIVGLFCTNLYALDSGAVIPVQGVSPLQYSSYVLFQTTGMVSCNGKITGYSSYYVNPQPMIPQKLTCPSPFKLSVSAIPTTIYQTVELLIGGVKYDSAKNTLQISLMCPTVVGSPGNNLEGFTIQFLCTH